jgi:ATP-dependent DNA helicase RecQ
LDPKEILQQYWGYSSFRPLQEDIIQSVLAGNDTLALLPTGGGKSICFQLPALAMEGICIVVSPLIALMKDQVANLVKRNIKAVAIYSGQNPAEIDIAIDNCVYGNVKFLYLSPERLTTEIIRTRLPKMKVNLLAIDEAHCISQWGYDFRPPYLQIAEVRELLPQTPALALTATATREVMEDICKRLEFRNHNIFIKSFERKNLIYAVLHEESKLERLLKICNRLPGTGIVYVRNRKKTQEIALFLQKHRIAANYYHAGLDATTRDRKQKDWTQEKTRIIVSTNAFGMGIDKPNVRFVVHMDLPDSPEAYFQEAGRGGRDEKKAYAVLLYNNSDLIDLDRSLENSYPPPDFIKNIYNALGNYYQLATGSGKDKSYDFSLSDFCTHYSLPRITTFNAIKFLEKEGFLFLSEALANPSKILILLKNEELYRFYVASPAYENFLKTILRSYTGLFSDFTRIDENEIAKRLKSTPDEVSKMFKKLHQLRVLHYEARNTKPRVTFLHGRLDIRDIIISPENYQERKTYATHRIKAIKSYVTAQNKCRSIILLEYFGEKNAVRCGKCDVCLERNKLDISKLEFDNILNLIKPALLDKNLTIHQLLSTLNTSIPEQKIIKTLQWLIDNQKISLDPQSNKISWDQSAR